jgi:ABC-2 type transport system permease protein
MSWSRSAAVARHEYRIMASDPSSLMVLTLMPLIMITFLRPIGRLALQQQHPGANGAAFTVPAMATMFAFFAVSFISFTFLSDRQWGTWARLLASPASNAEIMLGKVIPSFSLAAGQQLFLFGAGFVLFGLRPKGSTLALAAVVLALCLCLTAIGVLLAAIFKTNQQMNVFTNLGTMLLSGVSGAFVPLELLPSWARHVAPIAPQYWALRGYRAVILDSGGLSAVVVPVAVLCAMGLAAGVGALWRFRFDEEQVRSVKLAV